MVRWYIRVTKCLGKEHEHIIDVTPREFVIKKIREEALDKNKVYTTVYHCLVHDKNVLATFNGGQAYREEDYREDASRDSRPIVENVREVLQKEDQDWLDHDNKQQKELGKYFCDRADTFSTLWTAVFGIYSALLLLFGLMMSGGSITLLQWPRALVFLLPIVPWLIGICFLLNIYIPSTGTMIPNSPAEIRENYYLANMKKAKSYRNGVVCFSIGILFIVVALVIGLYWMPVPDTGVDEVQFIIKGDYVTSVQAIPINMIPNTNKTVVLQLQNTTETGYRIQLENGNIVELDKTWIQTVIWVSNTTKQGSQPK